MALYRYTQNVSGATAQDAANAHARDSQTQDRYGMRYLDIDECERQHPGEQEPGPGRSTWGSTSLGLSDSAALLGHPGLAARPNNPVRIAVLQRMQQTAGNRATQRAIQRSPAPDEDKEASLNRKRRTVVSNTLRAAREGSKAAVAVSAPQAAEAAAHKSVMNAAEQGDMENVIAGQNSFWKAHQSVENSVRGKLARALTKYAGSDSRLGKGLRASNYGLQFWQNISEGQGLDEAVVGAGAGGLVSNNMAKYLFSNQPVYGWTDLGVNLVNAGLQVRGASEGLTTGTQALADATPSSFMTSVASNAARGLWDFGKGAVTGDWSSLEKQGEDITHGKAGAPLQGYGLGMDLLFNSRFHSRENLSEITDDMRKGKWGKVPKASLQAKDWLTNKRGYLTDDQKEWLGTRRALLDAEHRLEDRDDSKRKASDEAYSQEMHAKMTDPSRNVRGAMTGGSHDPLSGVAIADSVFARSGLNDVDDTYSVPMRLR